MKLKQYITEQINEDILYTQSLIENTISYDLYCKILDDIDLEHLIENSIDESQASIDAKSKGLEYIGFGRYADKDKKDTVVAVSKGGKLVDIEPHKEDEKEKSGEDESDKIKLKNVAEKLKKHIEDIGNDLKVSKDQVVEAFKQPSVYNTIKHFGFSLKSMAKATQKTIATLNVGLKGVFEEISKTNSLKKLKSGAIKVDEFLDKHKTLKKITGAAVGGFMIYQWLNMSFSGDIDDDYDLSNLKGALDGTYGMKDLLGTPNGLKGLAQLGVGLATAGGMPIWVGGVKGIRLALLYSGAKIAKNQGLVGKLKKKMVSMIAG